VRLHGELVRSKGKGQAKEFLVDEVQIIGSCDPEVRRLNVPHHAIYDLASESD
jgi:hypothetical protein